MHMILVERIENNRIEKFSKTLKILAIVTVVLAIGKVFLKPSILIGAGNLLDYLICFSPLYFYFDYKRKTKNWQGQFIEWRVDSFEFKTRNTSNILVPYNLLESIDIKFDQIEFKLKSGSTSSLSLEDFTDYKDRMRIKSNFEKLKLTSGITVNN